MQPLQLLLALSVETRVFHPTVLRHDERRERHIERDYLTLIHFLYWSGFNLPLERDGREVLAALGFRDGNLACPLAEHAVVTEVEPRIDLRQLEFLFLEIYLYVVVYVICRVRLLAVLGLESRVAAARAFPFYPAEEVLECLKNVAVHVLERLGIDFLQKRE